MRESKETIPAGHIVKALAGRDDGRWFLVVGEQNGPYLMLADGRTRHMKKPKKKNIRHVRDMGLPEDAPQLLESIEEMRDDGQREAAIRTFIGAYRQEREEW